MQRNRYSKPRGIAKVLEGTRHYLGKAALPVMTALIVHGATIAPTEAKQGITSSLQEAGGRVVYIMYTTAENIGTAKAEPMPKYKAFMPRVSKNYPPQIPAMSGKDYALSIGIPEEIAEQFSSIARIDENAFRMINETKGMEKYYDVFIKRPDILAQYISDGNVRPESLTKFRDLDSDGKSNAVEMANGTNLFNPCDKDPANPSKQYVILLSGAQVIANNRNAEIEIEAGPLWAYYIFKRLGVSDENIYLFEQHRYPAVVGLLNPFYLLKSRNVKDEDTYIRLVRDSGLLEDARKFGLTEDQYLEQFVREWRNGTGGISYDLLTHYGPVQIDYLNQAVTKANLKKVFAEIRSKVKPNDEIYFLRSNHGGPRWTSSIDGHTEPPGFIINYDPIDRGLFPYDINDFLKGISYCRAFDIQHSSYAGALGQEIFLDKDLKPSPVGGPTMFVGTSNPENTTGNAVLFSLITFLMEENPYLTVQQVLDKSYQPWTGSRGFVGYTNTNDPSIKNQFFFFPRAR